MRTHDENTQCKGSVMVAEFGQPCGHNKEEGS